MAEKDAFPQGQTEIIPRAGETMGEAQARAEAQATHQRQMEKEAELAATGKGLGARTPSEAEVAEAEIRIAERAEPLEVNEPVINWAKNNTISPDRAAEILGRFVANPNSSEFKDLSPDQISQMETAANLSRYVSNPDMALPEKTKAQYDYMIKSGTYVYEIAPELVAQGEPVAIGGKEVVKAPIQIEQAKFETYKEQSQLLENAGIIEKIDGKIKLSKDITAIPLNDPQIRQALIDVGFNITQLKVEPKIETKYFVRGIPSSDGKSFQYLEPKANDGQLIQVDESTYKNYEKWLTKSGNQEAARQYLVDGGYGESTDTGFTVSLEAALRAGVPAQILLNAGFTDEQVSDARFRADMTEQPTEAVSPQESKWETAKIYLNQKTGETYTEKEYQQLISEYEAKRDELAKAGKMFTPEWFALGENPANLISASGYGEDSLTEYKTQRAREALSKWTAPEITPPEDITVSYLDKIASIDFFANGGSAKERTALAEAQRRAGFPADIQVYRDMSNDDKEKVVEQYRQEPVISRMVEENIDKPVSDFLANLENDVKDINNPIWKILASYGIGGLSMIGGGTEALVSSMVKTVSDLAEGYHKKAAVKSLDIPIGMTEWAGVVAPQSIYDDPISGVPMVLGALTMPYAIGKVGVPVVRQTFKTAREVIPSKFEPTNLGMEVSIPRTQLKGGLAVKDAVASVREMETVLGGKVPDWVVEFAKEADKTAKGAGTTILNQYLRGNKITGLEFPGEPIGGVHPKVPTKLSYAPSSIQLENVLYSVKPDILDYVKRIGETGSDVTPVGSMEWWSPNFSADVASWYFYDTKIKNYSPGGKMLRYTVEDLAKDYPKSVYESVLNKMRDPDKWRTALDRSKIETRINWDDAPTAWNILWRDEVLRRAKLPPTHPDALPQAIYPVFKFHWSYEPSGKWRPTWELEYVTPSGFESVGLKPTKWSSSLKTGGEALPEVATIDTYSPIQGKSKELGREIKLGQKMPIAITATPKAVVVGKGVPTLADMYAIKFIYKPLKAVVNVRDIFTRPHRPMAREGEVVTTPRKWYSRTVKLEEIPEARRDIVARNILDGLPEAEKLSTMELAGKLGETVENNRIVEIREPYLYQLAEKQHPKGALPKSTDWVVPRVAGMVEHPTIRGAYIVFNDFAERPNVWSLGGGQIDPRGTPRISGRKFGSITLEEALREQFLSEIGMDLTNIRPAKIHEGKTTEHSAYGTYMFDAKPKALDPMLIKEYLDSIPLKDREVRAIRILQSGDSATVTPSLYLELQRRGFDVTNLKIYDKNLPTSGIRQYPSFTKERQVLDRARRIRNPRKIEPTNPEKILYYDKSVLPPELPKADILRRVIDDPFEYFVPYMPEPTYAYPGFAITRPSAPSIATTETPPSPTEARIEMATNIEPISEAMATFESQPEAIISETPSEIPPEETPSEIPPEETPPEETPPEGEEGIPPEEPPTDGMEGGGETVPPEEPIEPPPEEPTESTPTTETPIEIPPEIPPPKIPPERPLAILLSEESQIDRVKLPYGSLTWRQGNRWGYLPKEKWQSGIMQKVIWLKRGQIPAGIYKYAEGKGSATKTLQILPAPNLPLPRDTNLVDMGFITVLIKQLSGGDVAIRFIYDPTEKEQLRIQQAREMESTNMAGVSERYPNKTGWKETQIFEESQIPRNELLDLTGGTASGETTIRPYQGKTYTATVKANTERELQDVIARMQADASEQGMENFRVIRTWRDRNGGYAAEIWAHNWNPFKWVKQAVGTIAGKIKGIFAKRATRQDKESEAQAVVSKEAQEAKQARLDAQKEAREANEALRQAEKEQAEAEQARATEQAEKEAREAAEATARAEKEAREAEAARQVAQQQESEAKEATKALEAESKRRAEYAKGELEDLPEFAWLKETEPEPVASKEEINRKLDDIAQTVYQQEVERQALKETLASSNVADLVKILPRRGAYKGELHTLTLKQYRDLTGKQGILPNILTPDKKHVRWEYALDELATERGYASGDALKEAVEQAKETRDKIGDISLALSYDKAEARALKQELKPKVEVEYERPSVERIVEPIPETERPEEPYTTRDTGVVGLAGQVSGTARESGIETPTHEEIEAKVEAYKEKLPERHDGEYEVGEPSGVQLDNAQLSELQKAIQDNPDLATSNPELASELKDYLAKPTAKEQKAILDRQQIRQRVSSIMGKLDGDEKLNSDDLSFLMAQKYVDGDPPYMREISDYQEKAKQKRQTQLDRIKQLIKKDQSRLMKYTMAGILHPKAKPLISLGLPEVGLPLPEDIWGELPEPEPTPAEGINKESLYQYDIGDIKVYKVNGDYIRQAIDKLFKGSASDLTMPSVIPENEVWVEDIDDIRELSRQIYQRLLEKQYVNRGYPPKSAFNLVEAQVMTLPDPQSKLENLISLGGRKFFRKKRGNGHKKESVIPTNEYDIGSMDRYERQLESRDMTKRQEDEILDRNKIFIPAHYRTRPDFKQGVDDKDIIIKPRYYLGRKLRPSGLGTGV